MGRNHANRIVSEIDPKYANASWKPEEFRPPTYRVAAYTRVAENSGYPEYGLKCRQHYYETAINAQPSMQYVGIYADEGIFGDSARNCEEFDRMVADCKAGKIDLVVVKDISCFSNRLVDGLNKMESLLTLDSPVDIYIEDRNINTLTAASRKTFLAMIDMMRQLQAGQQHC